MKLALLGFLAGLAVVGLMGCESVRTVEDRIEQEKANRVIAYSGIEARLTERLNASELHLSQRLERIEANQTALMLRFGFRPEGGQ